MPRLSLSFVLAIALLPSFAAADQISLKNGDRLSGQIVKTDGKTLTLKSDLAGTVTIPWDAVTGVNSNTALHVGLRDGQHAVGQVSTVNEKTLEIQTKDAGKITAVKEAVQYMRSEEEQAAWQTEIDRYRNPRLVDLWTGFVDFGLASARGNASTSNVAVSAAADRATSRDKIEVRFTSLYASASREGKSLVTANAIRGGIRYNLNISPVAFGFGSTDLEFDEFQDLDLRFAPAGGVGFHVFKGERTTLDVLTGASLNREFFSNGLNRTSGEAMFSEELTHKANSIFSITQKLTMFPNLTSRGDYRAGLDMAAITKLAKWFSWQFAVSDRLLSNPVFGRKRNDILFTSGFRLTFAK